jgi:hypothetical protein
LGQQAVGVMCDGLVPSQTSPRLSPAHKENKHEAGRTKKLPEAQESKEAPCYEEVHSGEEINRGESVKSKTGVQQLEAGPCNKHFSWSVG